MTDIGSALRDLAPDRPAPAGLAERVRERVRRGRHRRRILRAVGAVAVVALVGVGIGVSTGDKPTTVTVVAGPSRSATPSAAPVGASPTPSVSPGAVPLAGGPSTFVGISDGQLFRYDATTGQRLAALSPRLRGPVRAVAAALDGSLVVASDAGGCASDLTTVPEPAAPHFDVGHGVMGQVHAIALSSTDQLALVVAPLPQPDGSCADDRLAVTSRLHWLTATGSRTWSGPSASDPGYNVIDSLGWLPGGGRLVLESGQCCAGVYGYAVLDTTRAGSRYPLAPDLRPPCYATAVASHPQGPVLAAQTCTDAGGKQTQRLVRLVAAAGMVKEVPVAPLPAGLTPEGLAVDRTGQHALLLMPDGNGGRTVSRVDGPTLSTVPVTDSLAAVAW